jgi:hypothetical protein
MRNALNIAKTRLNLTMMAGFKGFTEVVVPEIPKEWDSFLGTKDEWVNVALPFSENSTSCLFKGIKDNVVYPHSHPNNKEHITILNEGGKIKILSYNKGTEIIEYPNSYVFESGDVHAVYFLEATTLMIIWHPMFESGWEGKFKAKDN